jgi:hypothetical protein
MNKHWNGQLGKLAEPQIRIAFAKQQAMISPESLKFIQTVCSPSLLISNKMSAQFD